MKKVTRNEVDFAEIFFYAEEKFGVDWNRANDMFFDNSLKYKSHNEFVRGELGIHIELTKEQEEAFDKGETPKIDFHELSEEDKGYYIIEQFMIDNDIDDLYVDNT